MENQNLNTRSSGAFEMGLDETGKANLKNAAAIGGIAAIIGLVNIGLGVVKYFIDKGRPVPEEMQRYGSSSTSAFGILGLVISITIGFLFFYFLNKFSTQAKAGLATSNSQLISEGLGNLANYYKTIGIILIIVLCLFVLAILGAIAGSALAPR